MRVVWLERLRGLEGRRGGKLCLRRGRTELLLLLLLLTLKLLTPLYDLRDLMRVLRCVRRLALCLRWAASVVGILKVLALVRLNLL